MNTASLSQDFYARIKANREATFVVLLDRADGQPTMTRVTRQRAKDLVEHDLKAFVSSYTGLADLTPAVIEADIIEAIGKPKRVRLPQKAVKPRQHHATHCAMGHEYTDVNTIFRSDGHRACRTCKNVAAAKYREKMRAQA